MVGCSKTITIYPRRIFIYGQEASTNPKGFKSFRLKCPWSNTTLPTWQEKGVYFSLTLVSLKLIYQFNGGHFTVTKPIWFKRGQVPPNSQCIGLINKFECGFWWSISVLTFQVCTIIFKAIKTPINASSYQEKIQQSS